MLLICSALTDIFSTLSRKYSAEIDFGGGRRCFKQWSDILDCIWYQNPRASVSEHTDMLINKLTSHQGWPLDISSDLMDQNLQWRMHRSLKTSGIASKGSLTSFSIRLTHSSFTNILLMTPQYLYCMIMMSMTMWMIWTIPLTHMKSMLAPPIIS